MTDQSFAVIDALDAVARAHRVGVPAVALAWLLTRPAVTAPITGANTPEQLAELLPAAELALTTNELQALDTASAGM